MEKQRDKAAKRMERKLNRGLPEADSEAAEPDESGGPPAGQTDDAGSPQAASNPEETAKPRE